MIMKRLLFFLALTTSAFSQSSGQWGLQQKNAGAGFTTFWATAGNNYLFATDGSGVFTPIPKSTFLTPAGNAATATALATPRAINGVNFDGTAPITVTAAAGTLTGTTLASNVVTSSLTAVGTIATGTWSATAISTAKGGLGADNSAATGVPLFATGTVTITGPTGSGNFVRATSPTLVTPALGTPSSGTLTNCTFPTLNQNTTGSAATLTTTRTIGGSNFNGSANVTSFPAPGAIGGTTPSTGAFTTLTSTGQTVNGDILMSPNGTAARTISWGTGYDVPALYLYDGGAGVRHGWGLRANETQFFGPTGSHYSWNKGGDFQVSGTNELMRLDCGTGRLGINTTSPAYTLDVNGSGRFVGDLTLVAGINLPKTITAAGTTGAQTINKPSGSVNFAAGATSLVVTNSLCTTSSVITGMIATNDATANGLRIVAGSGSFTIYMLVAPTSECRVNWLLTN